MERWGVMAIRFRWDQLRFALVLPVIVGVALAFGHGGAQPALASSSQDFFVDAAGNPGVPKNGATVQVITNSAVPVGASVTTNALGVATKAGLTKGTGYNARSTNGTTQASRWVPFTCCGVQLTLTLACTLNQGSGSEGEASSHCFSIGGVGGIAELPDADVASELQSDGASGIGPGLLAGIAAVAVGGVIALGAAGWYARGRQRMN